MAFTRLANRRFSALGLLLWLCLETIHHSIRWKIFPRNPITGENPGSGLRQSAKRQREPEVLTVDEFHVLLAELVGIYRVMVYVAIATGVRVSELLGLHWSDCLFEAGEILLQRGWGDAA